MPDPAIESRIILAIDAKRRRAVSSVKLQFVVVTFIGTIITHQCRCEKYCISKYAAFGWPIHYSPAGLTALKVLELRARKRKVGNLGTAGHRL